MPATDTAPDLTLICKSDALAGALLTILIETDQYLIDLDGSRTDPYRVGSELTIPWAGDPRFAVGVAEMAVKCGIATKEEGTAMCDRAASWGMDLPLDEVVRMREEVEQKEKERGPNIEQMLADLLGGR